jgi:hypothetical protein
LLRGEFFAHQFLHRIGLVVGLQLIDVQCRVGWLAVTASR